MKTAILLILLGSTVLAQEPSDDEIDSDNHAIDEFHVLDRNQDGRLTRGEFNDTVFSEMDLDKDGGISVEEGQKFLHGRRSQESMVRLASELMRAAFDIPYAATLNRYQRLIIYLPQTPKNDKPLPVVAGVHPGLSRRENPYKLLATFVESGEYAGVSIGCSEAIWPDQIHDCKAAIRWLRANAKDFNLDPDRIAVTGISSGGHLAAMLGTSGDVESLDGELGDFPKVSSRVSCVVDLLGQAFRPIGGPLQGRNASPITYVSADGPPFMLIHGTKGQADMERLDAALFKVGVESVLIPITGGEHGNFEKSPVLPEVAERMRQFFDKHLLGKDVVVFEEPIKPKKGP